MVVTPPVVGAVLSGVTWRHALLVAAWLAGYLALAAGGLWLRSRRQARYRTAVLVYAGVATCLGVALVAVAPRLLVWAPVFAVALAATLFATVRRAERAWLNDAVSVAAAAVMAPVANTVGTHPDLGVGWAAAGVMFTYFFGTVLYVKTMIRERGRRSVLVASVMYHVVVALVGWFVHPVLGVVATVLAVRAWAVPTRWPGAKPKTIGLSEVAATLALAVATWLAFG
ncbi:MAG: YwiC-like family protein [Micrococcales bacterium]|nr:YwiC-like family protein [Micrococcales bacterium]